MKHFASIGLFLAAIALGGCNYLKAIAYVFAPAMPDKTEEAEFKGLPNKTVAVVVYADQRVLYDYRELREQISGVIGYHLSKNVNKLKTVDPERITRFQNQNADWEGMSKTALGKRFGADFVLYVSVIDFATIEPGSTYLHHGRLESQVMLYDCSLPEDRACVWNGGEIHTNYPEKEIVGKLNEDDRLIRNETIRTFSEMLAKKFYKHKVPKE